MPNLSGSAPAHFGPPKHTIEIGGEAVSRFIGKDGESLKLIELATGSVIKIGSTHDHGILCRVYGSDECAPIAADVIRVRLTNIFAPASGSDDLAVENMEYQHIHIGRTLGKEELDRLKRVIKDSGASLQFVKDTPDGPEALCIVGKQENVQVAKRLIQSRLQEKLTIRLGPVASFSPEAISDITVSQQFSAWIFGGKNKQFMTQIADRSGASIHVMHGILNEDGSSIIRISGNRGAHDAAFVRVTQRIDQSRSYQEARKLQCLAGDWVCPLCGDQQFRRNESCRHCGCPRPAETPQVLANSAGGRPGFLKGEGDDSMQVEQRCVGFLIGPGGATLKEIKEMSGAQVFVDQDTRDEGYSIIRIGDKSSPEALVARELLEKKIQQCLDRFAQLPSNVMKAAGAPMVLPVGTVAKAAGGTPAVTWSTPPQWGPANPPMLSMGDMGPPGLTPGCFARMDVGPPAPGPPGLAPGCFARTPIDMPGDSSGFGKGLKGNDKGKGKDKGMDKGKGKDKGMDKGMDKGQDKGKGKEKGKDGGSGKGKKDPNEHWIQSPDGSWFSYNDSDPVVDEGDVMDDGTGGAMNPGGYGDWSL